MADSIERWDDCASRYREWAANDSKHEYMMNMVRLIEHLKLSGDVSALWHSTSVSWLCVSKAPNWDAKERFFSIGAYEDGSFQIQSYKRIARPSGRQLRRNFEQTVEVFWQFAEAL